MSPPDRCACTTCKTRDGWPAWTPGTPPLYREETLKRLFLTGYSAEEIALFGSDQLASAYDPEHVRALLDTDQKIMEMLGISESAIGNYHSGNLRRFLEGNLE